METHLKLELPPLPRTADNLQWIQDCIQRLDEQMALLEAQRQLYVQMRESMGGAMRRRPRPGAPCPRTST